MPHYKTLLDPTEFIGPHDFPEPKQVTISRVVREPTTKRDETTMAPIMYFAAGGNELKRKYRIPSSVMHGLALTFGTDYESWSGKTVEMYAATCLAFGEREECVRIRFAPKIHAAVKAWMKKRKASPNSYVIDE